ncbi:hypothetical protein C1J03_03815 [Sulfitobacter sp. SK012]|uniref:hypothetical protein n=1 Tax=Sulfitobacter sp. SK012 TaxID=1389005 RepID=UPI000E0A0EDA|nr:hypothetical protein [Sulfitobacter sp. SK012]AXI45238.1 hypothetical protein C1J03_03815 [Sulfitobacter sp. SK012]
MRVSKRLGLIVLTLILGAGGLEIGERVGVPGIQGPVSSAEAEVGRPLTPVSVAGVARRNNRRN